MAENNRWGHSTPISKQTKATDLDRKAVALRHPGVVVDGNDAFAVQSP